MLAFSALGSGMLNILNVAQSFTKKMVVFMVTSLRNNRFLETFAFPIIQTSYSLLPAFPPYLSFTELLDSWSCYSVFLFVGFVSSTLLLLSPHSECLLILQDSAQAPSPPRSLHSLQSQTGISGTFMCFWLSVCFLSLSLN